MKKLSKHAATLILKTLDAEALQAATGGTSVALSTTLRPAAGGCPTCGISVVLKPGTIVDPAPEEIG